MRVTSNSLSNNLINQLGGLASQQSTLQTQVSTGQRVRQAEDDPAAMHQVLNLQAEARSVDQYKTNVSNQQMLADATYLGIKSLSKISSRAGELATLADGLKSPDELVAYANEVNELIKQAVNVVNVQSGGSYLFAGTKSDQKPFVISSNENGLVTSVAYVGNETVNQTEISEGTEFSVQVVGANTSGSGPRGLITDTAGGADFFNHLIALRDNLLAGNTSAIADTDRVALGHDEDNLLYHIGLNGASQSRLQSANTALKNRTLSLNGQVADAAGTDMAETMIRLTQAQTAYQAALQSSSKILSLSLMDYLR